MKMTQPTTAATSAPRHSTHQVACVCKRWNNKRDGEGMSSALRRGAEGWRGSCLPPRPVERLASMTHLCVTNVFSVNEQTDTDTVPRANAAIESVGST